MAPDVFLNRTVTVNREVLDSLESLPYTVTVNREVPDSLESLPFQSLPTCCTASRYSLLTVTVNHGNIKKYPS